MKYTLGQIVKITGGELHGDADTPITGIASLEDAGNGDLSFIKSEKFLPRAKDSNASALIVPARFEELQAPQIVTPEPFLALGKLLAVVAEEKQRQPPGIHPSACLGARTEVGANVSIGANSVAGRDCIIGKRVVIYPGVQIGDRCRIGDDTVLHSGVCLREEVTVGARTIIHCNTTIGADGFGYIQHENRHVKVPQIGTVEIGDDVEIGANTTIDRAALDKTVIGNGVKIDNHCHVAHNVQLGDHSIIMGYGKVAGSVKVGRGVVIAGNASIADNVKIGDGAILAAGTGVMSDVEPGAVLWGVPARPIRDMKRIEATLGHLPEMRKRIKQLERRMDASEAANE